MLSVSILEDDEPVATFELRPKPFISGAAGYASKGRVEIDGKKYSLTLSMIEI
jgi:hypothetical protein